MAKEFLAQVVVVALAQRLTLDEHFTVDGTLLEAWAGAKRFQPKGKDPPPPPDDPGNPMVGFHGEKRTNQTHESKTDPDALLACKGGGSDAVKLLFVLAAQKVAAKLPPPHLQLVLKGPSTSWASELPLHRRKNLFVEADPVRPQCPHHA